MTSRFLTLLAPIVLLMAGTSFVHAQTWHQHVDWAATNRDAGGSVDCPGNYLSLGVGYAIISGGRSAVINEALFAAYRGDIGRAYQLVLLTQCHNGGAQNELIGAGGRAVVGYLVQNWTPTGIDPQLIQQGIQIAAAALAGN